MNLNATCKVMLLLLELGKPISLHKYPIASLLVFMYGTMALLANPESTIEGEGFTEGLL